jgi:uncharacterized protein (DUF885 family)
MLNRRELLLSSAALAVAGRVLPAMAADALPDPALSTLFDSLFQESLRASPERATLLGLDKGANADLKSKLSDHSAAGRAANKALNARQLAALKGFDTSNLSPVDRINYDTVLYLRESTAAIAAFGFGGSSFGPAPYAVSQLTGAYQSVPEFLDTKHALNTVEDADAYLSRLDAFAVQLDDETEQMKHDAGLGVSPPDYILDLTLVQLNALQTPADQSLLVKSITRRAAEKGLDAGYGAKASAIYTDKVAPAIARQIEEAKRQRATAVHDAGVKRFKSGEEFYAVCLRANTTLTKTPEEIHRFGLDQVKELSARLDPLLKTQGLTKGTVGERLAALSKDPRYLFPETDEGKAAIIAFCNERLDAIRPKLPSMFKRLPDYKFEVRRVPPATEPGAALAFSQAPPLDGSRPGLVYFNLKNAADWPKFTIETTVFHEGLPGHQLEGGLALSNKNLPLIRKAGGFSGYGEGWALYAEQLADEIGMYDGNPLGRIGYLKAQLFRACRCVIDTGLHHYGWSREKAIAYFVQNEGHPEAGAGSEVDRYTVQPGQACSYKLGHAVFANGREKAKKALGKKFDVKDYHEAVLASGRVPLDILQKLIDGYSHG